MNVAEQGSRPQADPAPAFGLLMTEPVRWAGELTGLAVAMPWLRRAPRGDGDGVLVLPGLGATDTSTGVLRRYLRRLGYDVSGWGLGRNMGPTAEIVDGLPRLVAEVSGRSGGLISVVGWSLGGIYARELARAHPALVRQVITLGSPFAITDSRQSRADRAYRALAHRHAAGRVPTREQVALPIPVPSTAVFSRRDGMVAWQACVAPEVDRHQNVEVRCGHLGFGIDPATLWVVADRLARDPATRRPFVPPRELRGLFPAFARG
jgi:pimeloyl-ACP methyl ester carboxylesterase